ncbi:MAG: DUF4065 domain-containing protein [Desulfobacteraceae bacterium]
MNQYFNTSNHPDDLNESFEYKKSFSPIFKAYEDVDSSGTIIDQRDQSWTTESTKKVVGSRSDTIVTVYDLAEYILKKLGKMTTMKLQKLVYYCQAWSLVWDEKVLFSEDIKAWANGPVVKELFNFHRGMFHISSVPLGNPDTLDENQKETINAVLDFYGNKSSQWLIDLTHQEEPWKKARVGMDISERGNRVIKVEDIAEYYSSLLPDS